MWSPCQKFWRNRYGKLRTMLSFQMLDDRTYSITFTNVKIVQSINASLFIECINRWCHHIYLCTINFICRLISHVQFIETKMILNSFYHIERKMRMFVRQIASYRHSHISKPWLLKISLFDCYFYDWMIRLHLRSRYFYKRYKNQANELSLTKIAKNNFDLSLFYKAYVVLKNFEFLNFITASVFMNWCFF